jgi:hypothetical protein
MGTSSVLVTVVAGAGQPLDWLWVDFCQLDILDVPVSPQVCLLRGQPVVASGQEGLFVLGLEPS